MLLILIVDDEPAVRKLMKKYLSDLGYEIEMGISGLQTIEIVDKDVIDLILLDIGLPDMGGHQVQEHIRRMSPETLVIMIITSSGVDFPSILQSIEKRYFEEALKMAKGNESKAAQLLQMSRDTFRYRRKKL
ncbi:MAG: DNA-binding response regulator [Pseudomonadota bacterium]